MKLFIAILIFLNRYFFVEPVCSQNLLGVHDKLFLLSDDQLDASKAEDRCNEFGANLATISDATVDTALKKAFTKYTKDLSRLWFYQQNVGSKKPIRASRTQINDPNWISLKGVTNSWFIDFYTASSSNLKPLYVCTNNGGNWIYGTYPCETGVVSGYTEQFKLYGGKSAATGYKVLYVYRSTVDPYKYANILLSTDRAYGPYITKQREFYVPVIDRNVFIGARYNIENKKWIWSNGSVANYNTEGLNKCQQKALHYGSDWELVNKECSGRKEYFVCQVNQNHEISVEHDVCNAKNLTIRWTDAFAELSKILSLQIKVKVSVSSHTSSQIVDYSQLSSNITNLQPRTDYMIKVRTMFQGCGNAFIESSLNFTTPLEIMDPVTNASVILQSGCYVHIPAAVNNPKLMKATYYEIVAKSTKNETRHSFPASTQSIVVSVPLHHHGLRQRVDFTIKAMSENCSTQPQNIQGHCISRDSRPIVFSTRYLCNSSILHVSWPETFSKLNLQTGDSLKAKVYLTDPKRRSITQSFEPAALQTKINNLRQGTSYSVKLECGVGVEGYLGGGRVKFFCKTPTPTFEMLCASEIVFVGKMEFIHEGSSNFTIEVTQTVVTANQTSDVTTAEVISSDPCLLQVKRTQTDLSVVYHVKNDVNNEETKFQTCGSSSTNDSCDLTIGLDRMPRGQTINFKVKISTCAGSSDFVQVKGHCATPIAVLTIAVGSAVGLLFVALLVVVFLLQRRRKAKQKSEENPVSYKGAGNQVRFGAGNKQERTVYDNVNEGDATQNKSEGNRIYDLFIQNCKNGFALFRKEFAEINEPTSDSRSTIFASKSENAKSNRYKNILPYDHARVVLDGDVKMNYINASYIPGFTNSRKFIASQGPKPSTVHDFWMMIYQQRSTVIVMLANITENGKPKCERYWPLLGKCKRFNDIRVSTTEENRLGGIIQRKFTVVSQTEKRYVKQFHYDTWPDHGTPATTSNMMYLRRMVEKVHDKEHPIIVHCSAGAGRTGTYIAMDYLFDQLDAEGKVDVKGFVLKMRENRMQMVQNVKQYCFVYKLILEYEQLSDSDQNVSDIQSLSESDLAAHVQKEFNILKNWRFGEKWQENKPSMQTYSSNAITIWKEETQTIEKMNASFIQDLGYSGTFIAAQVPQGGMQEMFWKMISMKQVGVVVCLENEANFLEVGGTAVYGSIRVDASSSEDQDDFSVANITLSSTESAFEPMNIPLMHVMNWNQPVTLPPASLMIKLAEQAQKIRSTKSQKDVVVCCRDGCGKTGTVIAIITILERLKIESRVDVMRTVKDLRDMRPNMVNEQALYSFCYTVLLNYLSAFSTYANYQ